MVDNLGVETLARRLWFKIRKTKGIDILVTHAPAAGFNVASIMAGKVMTASVTYGT